MLDVISDAPDQIELADLVPSIRERPARDLVNPTQLVRNSSSVTNAELLGVESPPRFRCMRCFQVELVQDHINQGDALADV